MDSEHRHELEENALARWLADKVEAAKPQLPLVLLGVAAAVAAILGWSGWKKSTESAQADRWRDFSVALESGSPDLIDLKSAAEANPGTPIAEWAEVTWADGKLFEGSQLFFRNRKQADESVAEAVEVYERLASAKDRDVADRATFQLARAYELQGKLDEAAKQYARVTGSFAQVAKSRITELESPRVAEAYSWITRTSASPGDATAGQVGSEPDDIPLPESEPQDADAALDDLLKGVEEEAAAEAPVDDETAAEGEDPVAKEPASEDSEAAEAGAEGSAEKPE
jgi:hypothetical protein